MIANIELVKGMLEIPQTDSSKDAVLTGFGAWADSIIKSEAKRDLEQATYTEFYTGDGTNVLFLRQTPVKTVNNLWIDPKGYFGDGTNNPFPDPPLVLGQDYSLDRDFSLQTGGPGVATPNVTASWSNSGKLVRLTGFWPQPYRRNTYGRLSYEEETTKGNIKVEYVGGYPANQMPQDLQSVACQLVKWFWLTRKWYGPFQSEQLADYNYTLAQRLITAWPELGSIQRTMARYRGLVL
jgi:hypothetical protein